MELLNSPTELRSKILEEAKKIGLTEPCYQKMLDYTAEELKSKTFWDVTHPDDHSLEEPHFADMMTGRVDTYRFEKIYLHKNGSTIWVSLNVADLKNAEGGVIGTLAAVEGITERKR